MCSPPDQPDAATDVLELTILIVSHGHEGYLPACLNSLHGALRGIGAEIVLVDNLGASLQGAALPAEAVPRRLLNNPVPLGFAANVNQGAREAQGRHLLILNPDTTYARGSLREMLAFLDANPHAGLLACKMLHPDGSLQPSYRRFPTVPVSFCRMLGADGWSRRPRFYRQRLMEGMLIEQAAPVDWVFGAFMLVRREQFLACGGMDAAFRLYYEDVDLCYRYREQGLRTYYFPDVVFYHHHLRTSASQPFSQARRWHARSMLRFFRKHGYVVRPPVEARERPNP